MFEATLSRVCECYRAEILRGCELFVLGSFPLMSLAIRRFGLRGKSAVEEKATSYKPWQRRMGMVKAQFFELTTA